MTSLEDKTKRKAMINLIIYFSIKFILFFFILFFLVYCSIYVAVKRYQEKKVWGILLLRMNLIEMDYQTDRPWEFIDLSFEFLSFRFGLLIT